MNATFPLRTENSAPVLETWFEAGRRARLVVDGNMVVLWSNSSGRALLDRPGPLMLSGDSLRPRNPTYAKRFQDFVRQADEPLSVMCLPDRESANHLLVTAVALKPEGLVGLTAFFALDALDYHWADLREAFGLTPCEREIAQALATGLTADAVAEKLRTSVKTVRTHIRHVYSKLGVSSREELFRKLTPYMLLD